MFWIKSRTITFFALLIKRKLWIIFPVVIFMKFKAIFSMLFFWSVVNSNKLIVGGLKIPKILWLLSQVFNYTMLWKIY